MFLKDCDEYYIQMAGYLKQSALNDKDYAQMLEKLLNADLEVSPIKPDELSNWLYYQIDLLVFNYYLNYKFRDNSNKDEVKLKIRYLYDKLNTCYPEFVKYKVTENIKSDNPLIDLYGMKKYMSVIIESGYCHQVLMFCFRVLIDDWPLDKIHNELTGKLLDDIFDRFINEYSNQSGIPCYILILFFIKMREKLALKLVDTISKYDPGSRTRLVDYLNDITGATYLNYYFGKDPDHDISDWCNQVKKKVIVKIAGFLY
jgi:hypothetical protein